MLPAGGRRPISSISRKFTILLNRINDPSELEWAKVPFANGVTVMNWKTWFPLILAIVLGVVAAKAAHDWVQKNKSAGVPAGKFVKIVVAKTDTQPGHELTGDDLTLTQMEATAAPG